MKKQTSKKHIRIRPKLQPALNVKTGKKKCVFFLYFFKQSLIWALIFCARKQINSKKSITADFSYYWSILAFHRWRIMQIVWQRIFIRRLSNDCLVSDNNDVLGKQTSTTDLLFSLPLSKHLMTRCTLLRFLSILLSGSFLYINRWWCHQAV